jgi:hypothetical protein
MLNDLMSNNIILNDLMSNKKIMSEDKLSTRQMAELSSCRHANTTVRHLKVRQLDIQAVRSTTWKFDNLKCLPTICCSTFSQNSIFDIRPFGILQFDIRQKMQHQCEHFMQNKTLLSPNLFVDPSYWVSQKMLARVGSIDISNHVDVIRKKEKFLSIHFCLKGPVPDTIKRSCLPARIKFIDFSTLVHQVTDWRSPSFGYTLNFCNNNDTFCISYHPTSWRDSILRLTSSNLLCQWWYLYTFSYV